MIAAVDLSRKARISQFLVRKQNGCFIIDWFLPPGLVPPSVVVFDSLLIVTPIERFCNCSMFCCALLLPFLVLQSS